jgi:hypothetical protein
MNGRIAFRIFLGLLVLALLAGVAVFAYNAGLARELALNGQLQAGIAEGAPYRYFYGGPLFLWPFGFPFLGCLFALAILFLFGAFMRGLFWHSPRRWERMHRRWEKGVPPIFDEWHQRAHEPNADEK